MTPPRPTSLRALTATAGVLGLGLALATPASAASDRPRVRGVERYVVTEDRVAFVDFTYRCTDPRTVARAEVRQDSRGGLVALYDSASTDLPPLPLVCDGTTRSSYVTTAPVGATLAPGDRAPLDYGTHGPLDVRARAVATVELFVPGDLTARTDDRDRRVEVGGREGRPGA